MGEPAEKHDLRRIFKAYRDLLGILFPKAPLTVISVFACTFILGALLILGVLVNRRIFDDGIALAQGLITFRDYLPLLILFVITALAPTLLEQIYIYGFVEPRLLLILRTSFKGRMLQKLARLEYEHLENKASLEVIDKAYRRAENACRHLFPMYVMALSGLIYGSGVIIYAGQIRWWLVPCIIAPIFLQVWYEAKYGKNIYDKLESYWAKERSYETLGGYLKSRRHFNEIKLFGAAGYLITSYRSRLNSRNREYESYFFEHFKTHFAGANIAKIGVLLCSLAMLYLYLAGAVSTGTFIALSTAFLVGGVFEHILWAFLVFRYSHMHINFFDYYRRYLALSEEEDSGEDIIPENISIEFRNVWFRYPGSERDILKGISFVVNEGEKLSLVGGNGEGKSTIIKLLLGLFKPDEGEILLGGRPLFSYSRKTRTAIFGPVFQDFEKYAISLRENIGIGNITKMADSKALSAAAKKAKVHEFDLKLPQGLDTILGREFEGGVDLSGGQWQRVAIARAFMGDKPILLLDEPTSQLDPSAESDLYREFSAMAEGKTAVFVTHRLASTMITDRILVIEGGVVSEEGSHGELMAAKGLYAKMFNAQKHWYVQEDEGGVEVG